MDDDAPAQRILATSPLVAVLGIHHDLARPAGYVPAYLHEHGYEVHGLNPALAGRVSCGRPVVATLADLELGGRRLDLVDVFRRTEAIADHLPELLAARPRVVWLQLGLRHDAVAAALTAAGIEVVQDRCTLADHRRFGLGRPAA